MIIAKLITAVGLAALSWLVSTLLRPAASQVPVDQQRLLAGH